MTYPFPLPAASTQPHPSMILNHTIAIDGGDQRRKDSVTKAYAAVASLSPPEIYIARFKRWAAWTRRRINLADPGFTRFEAQTKGRLIVGMGDESILENSLTLTWTDGVPVIPGSAIKGLIGAVARSGSFKVDGNRPLEPDETRILSGTVESASYFTFHDAWYVPQGATDRPLRVDVMTPHHQPYNSSRGARPPLDSDEPTIINFLAARGTFLFAIDGPDPNWTYLARQLLVYGLEHVGIGAKTSSGYGRFIPPDDVPLHGYSDQEIVVRARGLSKSTFDADSIDLAYAMAELDDDHFLSTVTRVFAQRTVDLGKESWLRNHPDWEVLEEYLAPAFDAIKER